jgi:hypothetical protein
MLDFECQLQEFLIVNHVVLMSTNYFSREKEFGGELPELSAEEMQSELNREAVSSIRRALEILPSAEELVQKIQEYQHENDLTRMASTCKALSLVVEMSLLSESLSKKQLSADELTKAVRSLNSEVPTPAIGSFGVVRDALIGILSQLKGPTA